MNCWYLIQFKPNSHFLAQRNLKRQGYETLLPMKKSTKRKNARFVNYYTPLFPSYMFVRMTPGITPWRTINSTIGVSRTVSFQGKTKTVPSKLVSELMIRCDEEGKILPLKTLSEGDSVKISNGTFSSFLLLLRLSVKNNVFDC